MKNTQILTSYKKTYNYPILDLFNAQIEITQNRYQLPLDDFFTMAARVNKKRSFLFVSKLIGKHIPVKPNKSLLASALLAATYYEDEMGERYQGERKLLEQFLGDTEDYEPAAFIPSSASPLIIGFAETATALGHAFFDCFQQAEYFDTTREMLGDTQPVITFEEEHSHATSHRCYIPTRMISHDREIILVDDELTTGKTALNIIRSIQAQFPRKRYTIVTILDWRNAENMRAFALLEQELAIQITVLSLLSGTLRIETLKVISENRLDQKNHRTEFASVEKISLSPFFTPVSYDQNNRKAPLFIKETGRFGLSSKENVHSQEKIEEAAALLRQKRTGKKTLCLGTGEFMYLPLAISSKLGEDISFQSTTRSPIAVSLSSKYGAQYGITFSNPENPETTHFVYNIPPNFYDELFLFMEREVEDVKMESLLLELHVLGFESIKLVYFSKIQGGDIDDK